MSEQTGMAGTTRGGAAAPRSGRGIRAPSHTRRRVLALGSGVAAVGVAAGAGYLLYQPSHDRQLVYARVSDAMKEVDRLHAASAQPIAPATAWSWSQTLEHCAQSIEFSLAGFPEPKSAVFQHTAGAAAFGLFAWRGRMSHNLAEPIPGAPALTAPTADASAAMARLKAAVTAFELHPGPLHPHFAYGMLSRSQYEHAHAMHLANHLSAFDARIAR
ncbi:MULTISPECIES: DUF1569 domain-containing protein [unclassified Acidovorax]|uniref:DUF1569 domain-containing protein n=1 Tax=unclassified Acidovorax TaxID=2684926 RepID=UPI000A58D374|nr:MULTISPECIES: DUF1569 domain-containing protein [unclassified Acidovorax]